MGDREYIVSMDRYVGFAYHTLIGDLLRAETRRLGVAANNPERSTAKAIETRPVLLRNAGMANAETDGVAKVATR